MGGGGLTAEVIFWGSGASLPVKFWRGSLSAYASSPGPFSEKEKGSLTGFGLGLGPGEVWSMPAGV